MSKRKQVDIEKIYVCKTDVENPNIIEKVLIQYVDGNQSYFALPSFYHEMKPKRQEKERVLLDKNLKHYMKMLAEQNHSSEDYQENSKVILVSNQDEELKQYVDYQIKRIKNKFYAKTENSYMRLGLLNFFTAGLSYTNGGSFGVMLNTILSIYMFNSATKRNKRRDELKVESSSLKRLKLYFSYLMIALNVGLNVRNLSVNFEKMQYAITLVNTVCKQNEVLSDLENHFSDSDSQFLVTTGDAATNLLMEAFQLNPFLDDKDLEIALSMENYIENNPYLDYEKLYEIFASFGMIHVDYDNNMVAGTTLRGLNIITIYDYENAKKDPYYITTLQHEIIHLTGHLDNFVLNEGMTELLQAEYFNDGNATGYYEYVIFTKIFCELIGSDKMLEAYSKNDMSIIQEEMLKINPSEHDYDSLMNAMQEYGTKYQMADELKELPDVDKYPFYLLLLPY